MRWFSHDWHDGRMADEQAAAVDRDYQLHVRQIRDVADPSTVALLGLNLHDAQVHGYTRVGDSFEWKLLVGDRDAGYEFVTLTYSGAEVLPEADWDALRLTDPGVEVRGSELELLASGATARRLLLWPEGEVWIHYRGVKIATEPATEADRLQHASETSASLGERLRAAVTRARGRPR
ncbi:hypothetical protein AB6N24_08905 [Cellulomonas sp. 179-A 4D5 NHS]|uniref:hypothetical protein n=1 Tax=Cellulomonas sp. 179-A 4D5 NHS TaxID=3142378 RepID=UPI00399F4D79